MGRNIRGTNLSEEHIRLLREHDEKSAIIREEDGIQCRATMTLYPPLYAGRFHRCELAGGHDGDHKDGVVVWHDIGRGPVKVVFPRCRGGIA